MSKRVWWLLPVLLYWEAVQQLTPTQPKVPIGSNRTEQHVKVLLEKRLRHRALPEEARSVKRQVVVSKRVKDGPKKVCFMLPAYPLLPTR